MSSSARDQQHNTLGLIRFLNACQVRVNRFRLRVMFYRLEAIFPTQPGLFISAEWDFGWRHVVVIYPDDSRLQLIGDAMRTTEVFSKNSSRQSELSVIRAIERLFLRTSQHLATAQKYAKLGKWVAPEAGAQQAPSAGAEPEAEAKPEDAGAEPAEDPS